MINSQLATGGILIFSYTLLNDFIYRVQTFEWKSARYEFNDPWLTGGPQLKAKIFIKNPMNDKYGNL